MSLARSDGLRAGVCVCVVCVVYVCVSVCVCVVCVCVRVSCVCVPSHLVLTSIFSFRHVSVLGASAGVGHVRSLIETAGPLWRESDCGSGGWLVSLLPVHDKKITYVDDSLVTRTSSLKKIGNF